jgi:hypothetical protein
MTNFEPNLDPEPLTKEEIDDFQTPEQRQKDSDALDDFLDDLSRTLCTRCQGVGYTIKFGRRVPCPFGVKILRASDNAIVCYEPE